MTRGPPRARPRRGPGATCATSVAGAAAVVWASLVPVVATDVRADLGVDPLVRLDVEASATVLASLASAYRAGTLDVWQARLYQDLRIEAGQRAALLTETATAYPDERAGLASYLHARLADRKSIDAELSRCALAMAAPGPALLDLGWLALVGERLVSAQAVLARVKKALPEHEEAVCFEAAVLREMGRHDEALRLLTAFVAGRPDAVEARRALARATEHAGKRAAALAILDEGLSRRRAPALIVERGWMLLAAGDPDEATKAVDALKDAGRPAVRAEAAAVRAMSALFRRDPKAALAAADAGLSFAPRQPSALRARARALELLDRGSEALESLDDALRERPDLGALWADKGAVLLRAKQGREARKALAEARKRDPDDASVALLLGALAEEDEDWSVAEKHYRTVLRRDPDHHDARRLLANVAFHLGRLPTADQEAATVLARDPKDPAAWFLRGRVAYKQDRLDDALAFFEKAVAADPKYALGHCGKGWVFEQQEKFDDAKQAYEAAVAAEPEMPLPHRELAEVLEELSDSFVSLRHYRRYLELGGPDPDGEVKRAIDRVSK